MSILILVGVIAVIWAILFLMAGPRKTETTDKELNKLKKEL